jgi:hypothetical protein
MGDVKLTHKQNYTKLATHPPPPPPPPTTTTTTTTKSIRTRT